MERLKDLNVLFLEDNEGFSKNTMEFLNIYFNNILHCSTIEEAINIFTHSRIDVIISDIKVADGNGLDFIIKVRESDKDVPIIVLSAHKDEELFLKAVSLNVTAYVLKPVGFKEFISLLEKLIGEIS